VLNPHESLGASPPKNDEDGSTDAGLDAPGDADSEVLTDADAGPETGSGTDGSPDSGTSPDSITDVIEGTCGQGNGDIYAVDLEAGWEITITANTIATETASDLGVYVSRSGADHFMPALWADDDFECGSRPWDCCADEDLSGYALTIEHDGEALVATLETESASYSRPGRPW